MRSDEAENRLRSLLAQAGVDVDRPSAQDVERTWMVMRAFADELVDDAEPREHHGDGLLAQYGAYDWGDGEQFELDITRQFTFADADGEYDHMSQLHCTFGFEASDELRAADEGSLWSFDLALDEFFEQALAMPGFARVRDAGLTPLRLVVEYGDV